MRKKKEEGNEKEMQWDEEGEREEREEEEWK